MEEKTILLIGRSGRGKSTLANVITGVENKFKESYGSVSETRKIQFEQFEDKDSKIDYSIIDTPGIGDTKMSDNEVLDIIAEAVYLARNGISQVLFVVGSRFDQYEMATYDLLRTIIFDNEITKHTTIIRTRFEKFKSEGKCKEDINLMIKESAKKKNESEDKIADNKNKMESLFPNSEECKKIMIEVEQLEKELKATDLNEIIESCQEKIIHVDNPPVGIKGISDSESNLNKKKRNKSRGKLLDHLSKNCQEDYKPEKLEKLSKDIADDYSEYLKKKEELQRELDSLKPKEIKPASSSNQVSKIERTEVNKNEPEDISVETNAESITEKEELQIKEDESDVGIIDINETIIQLQDKKERLKKEIKEKEKIIRQKVLKHIFNNYGGITSELGGDIFMESVIGNHNWENISLEFKDKELVVKWLSHKFDYEEIQKWAAALGNSFNPNHDADFCAWLRDDKKLTVDKAKDSKFDVEGLRREYRQQLEKEVCMLDKHNQQLCNNWKDIHKDFTEKWSNGKTYQQKWEEIGITYSEAQDWTKLGFKPRDYDKISQWKVKNLDPLTAKEWIAVGFNEAEEAKQWKDQGFTPEQTKSWINADLKPWEANFAHHLKQNNYQPAQLSIDKLIELRKEFYPNYSTVQAYLDKNYPWKERNNIKELNLRNLNLEGELDLKGFSSNLKVYVSGNPQLGEINNNNNNTGWIIYKNSQEYLNHQYSNKGQVKEIYLPSLLDFDQPNELVIDNYPNLKRVERESGGYVSNLTKVIISNCPQLEKIDITYLKDNQKLILDNLPNLKELDCAYNKLATLDLFTCPNLQKINCQNSSLTEIKLPSLGEKLEELVLSSNNFPEQDLSFLSHLVNLKRLFLGNWNQERISQGIYNRFTGSLESLRNLTKLEVLDIRDTDVNSGLEYLPESIWFFECSTNKRKNSKVKVIEEELSKFGKPKYDNFADLLKFWRAAHQTEEQPQIQIPPK